MSVRSKWLCQSKEKQGEGWKIEFCPVWAGTAADGKNAAKENRIFGDATPGGSMYMYIENKGAADQYEKDCTYYFDSIKAGDKVEHFYEGYLGRDGKFYDENGEEVSQETVFKAATDRRIREDAEAKVTIHVNGKDIEVDGRGLVWYESIFRWAFPKRFEDGHTTFTQYEKEATVTYHRGPSANPEGTLIAGNSSGIRVKAGMNFNCVHTGNA